METVVVLALAALILLGCAGLFINLGVRARRGQLPVSDFVGIRTPAIQSSRATWKHVHAKFAWTFDLCGALFIASAGATAAMAFMDPDSEGFWLATWVLLGMMGVVLVVTLVVSFLADREAKRFNASQHTPGDGFSSGGRRR